MGRITPLSMDYSLIYTRHTDIKQERKRLQGVLYSIIQFTLFILRVVQISTKAICKGYILVPSDLRFFSGSCSGLTKLLARVLSFPGNNNPPAVNISRFIILSFLFPSSQIPFYVKFPPISLATVLPSSYGNYTPSILGKPIVDRTICLLPWEFYLSA